jgi:hypothetical protein
VGSSTTALAFRSCAAGGGSDSVKRQIASTSLPDVSSWLQKQGFSQPAESCFCVLQIRAHGLEAVAVRNSCAATKTITWAKARIHSNPLTRL